MPKPRKSKPRSKPPRSIANEIRAVSPIKFGPKFFKVLVRPRSEWDCDDDHVGCIHFRESEIHILADRNAAFEMVDTLFHEALHGAVGLYIHYYKDNTKKYPEEEFVSAAEVGFNGLFLDNPKLLALFVKYWNPTNRQPLPQGDSK